MKIVIWVFTLFFGKKVGRDEFKNSYYKYNKKNKEKRWVIYKGITEATKVPVKWDMWLRFITNEIPKKDEYFTWQKERLPNLTGTIFAYKNKNIKTHNQYENWKQ